MRHIDTIIIHCSATYPDMDIGAAEIRDWHVNERGWSDIGYHYVIRRDGTVELGRDRDKDGNVDEEVGAHALGYNGNSIGICMIGGKARDGRQACNFTAAQWEAVDKLANSLALEYRAKIIGHNDVSDKDCPTFDVMAWQS